MSNLPKYFTAEKTVQKRSQQHESRVAKTVGGKTQKGSGAQDFHKGDVKSAELLIECKSTNKASLSIKREWLIKVFREAIGYKKIPALAFEFDEMPDLVAKDWIAIPAKTLTLLLDAYKKLSEDDDET